VNDKGEVVPGKVTVTVTFTNTTKATIDTAQLLLLAPEPVVRSQQLNQLALGKDSLPLLVGPFPPSSHASRKFTLAVTGDGKYQWRALAIYNDASRPGGNGRASAVGGAFEATVPLLYFTADIHRDAQADTVNSRNGSDWVKGGDQWYVGGEVKDLSSYQTICLSPLIANTDGNAEAVGLQDVSTHNAGDPEPPVAGLIKPAQSYPFGMLVVTSSTGSTNGSVDVPVKGFMADPGASCELQEDGTMSGAGAALTKDQTDITAGSTSYVVHVDVSVSPDVTPTNGVLNFFGGYAAGSFAVFATIARGLVAMAKSFHDDPQFYLDVESAAYNPLAAQRLLERANAHMMAITALMVNYLQTTIPGQSDDPSDFVYQVLDKVANDAYAKLAEGSKAITQQFAGNLVKAYETGSAAQIWNAWGNFVGEGAGNLVTGIDLQLFIEGAGSLMTAEAPELEAAAKAATEEPAVLTTSKGGVVPVGRVLSLADQARAWGFSEDTVNKLDQISQKYGVLIGARSRQAISTELEGLGAVWKSSNFHQKTVSAIDQLYLGMDGIRKGLLGFRSFTPAGETYARRAILEANLPAAEETEALMRLKGRFAENGEDFTHIEQMLNTERKACSTCPATKGWTNAGFNATGSGRATSSVSRWRRFTVKETPILAPDGTVLGTLYEPLEENIAYASAPKLGRSVPALCQAELGTVMCPITGDIDLVYITNLLGGSLSAAKMLEVFAALDEAGFAHTDLVTWIDQQEGSFFFKDKLDQLAGLVKGKESTVQFAPDGKQRATYLAPLDQSIATGPNSYQLTILGTYTPGMH
jgi:hypothetical protein